MQWSKPELEKCVHGSIGPAELNKLGLAADDVIDFSANVNPLGVSPRVEKALAGVDLARYPDPDCLELRQSLSRATGVSVEAILVGNGSTELIYLLAQACLAGCEPRAACAAILAPTFGEYESACRLAGVRPVMLQAREEDGFRWDVADVCREIGRLRPRLVFLCNPNNPTGLYLDKMAVEQIATAAAPGFLAIDEAYVAFLGDAWDATSLVEHGNVVLLRSMTKDHALAGLRLGYALAPGKMIRDLTLYQPSWSVNAAAQAAGLAALADPQHVSRANEVIAEARTYLYGALKGLGLEALPASANFLLIKVGDARMVRAALLRRGLCVRDCSSFGLPQHIRVAVLALPECRKLAAGLNEALRG